MSFLTGGSPYTKTLFNLLPNSEVYSEPCQTSKMELFAKKVNSFVSLTSFAKRFIQDVWQGSKYISESDESLEIIKLSKTEAYLKPSRVSTTELFAEIVKAFSNYFRKKALLWIFDWVLNTSLKRINFAA